MCFCDIYRLIRHINGKKDNIILTDILKVVTASMHDCYGYIEEIDFKWFYVKTNRSIVNRLYDGSILYPKDTC